MKFSTTLHLASIGSVSAFVAPDTKPGCLPLRMSDPNMGTEKLLPTKSASIPFMDRPSVLDGSMAGDVGFDPLGFAKSQMDLNTYREAEIKHARLAMLAAAGWPISELFDKKLAGLFGMTPLLDDANRVPSVLNGGMGKISPVYWVGCVVLAGAIDVYQTFFRANQKEYWFPGDLGFDPFGLYPKDEEGKKWMQTAEIKNGRLAMIAITAFAAQEFVTHVAIIDETPLFFKPIWTVLSDMQPATSSLPKAVMAIIARRPFFISAIWTVLSDMQPSYIIPPEETPSIFESIESITPPLDAAVITSAEAATAVIPPFDAVPSASVESTLVIPSFDAAPAVPTIPTAPTVPAVSPPVNNDELIFAKQRIAELESKLAAIGSMSR
eukprot:CAMPEP_0194298254 /NCGR_PEP_ID=MMETSP0169-20130528/60060_1 /TAXON_ID=218684 /ORGANISM="Corethron pennatum, Strain L29A3" /LENGTH=380 /DNA_ID=CAMNT_0039048219 /DNA_START=729 /DNA_END=1872 /DNA_ORIENTATION=-